MLKSFVVLVVEVSIMEDVKTEKESRKNLEYPNLFAYKI